MISKEEAIEEAKQLVDKFSYEVVEGVLLRNTIGKRCAIICLEEQIELIKSIDYYAGREIIEELRQVKKYVNLM